MMNCHNCSREIPSDANLCPYCGETVRKETAPATTHQINEPEMILIPAGKFRMGSDPREDEIGAAMDQELPQHILFLPDYYLAKIPVTNSQYATFLQATGYSQPSHFENGKSPRGRENHPVSGVSWHDAVAYCRWLCEVTGKLYRLPSEAEWEKGARGYDGRIYPWGSQWDPRRCNTQESGKNNTTPVGIYPQGASPYGLLDMAGNVFEWTASLWGWDDFVPDFKYPYDPTDGREDLEAGANAYRVVRSGAFLYDRCFARCAVRTLAPPHFSAYHIGFRLAVSPT